MSALLSSRTRVLGFLIAVAALALLPSATLAAKPELSNHFIDVTFPDVEFCGIVVTVHIEGLFNDMVFFDNDGNFVAFKSTGHIVWTITAENGKSVSIEFDGQLHETFVDNGDGTITIIGGFKGIPGKIVGESGGPLLQNAGLFARITTIDLETGDIVSSEVVRHGSKPDSTLICEVISEALV